MGGALLAVYLYEAEYECPLYVLQGLGEDHDLKPFPMVPWLTQRV
jgi:hypothetical protein